MGGGAWPFLVGGVICLVNSVNERDLNLLIGRLSGNAQDKGLLEGRSAISRWKDKAITGL
jgi:hypothetical protein